ncbi:hypothetical protein BT69DRAFT_1217016 [Atractiella rhizophila]|nr:hypothetical protein BT69DRAFT_1217016 [Atractiella rhizophila]
MQGGGGGGVGEEKKGRGKKEAGKERKKKASRACAACQKAHLTCDDDRPCGRCVKRGTPEQCHDGHRKKAKYLADYPDELVGREPPSAAPTNTLQLYDPQSMGVQFGSEAANLEYAILSSMLGGNGFPVDFGETNDPSGYANPSHPNPSNLIPPWNAREVSPPVLSSTGVMSPQEVYRKVTKPYPYTEAYHWLIRYLKENFEKNDILRIVRALSIFRPSLIALQMPLTEEDEVFVERCFQRTLIEYDKLIAMSGTPTVLFRRTGELCLVGTEFCLLTEWSREELLGQKKYIYEIFDHTSTVEYFEAFAMHAFENTTQAVMTTCVLLTPKKRPVPCTFCFTIKRDLFNCPQIVVYALPSQKPRKNLDPDDAPCSGQFLPILSG